LSFSHAFAAEIAGGSSASRDLKAAPRSTEPVLHPADGKEETWRKSLVLKPGFVARPGPNEPMLGNPVAFTFDDQGRCFTSETNRYRTSTLDIRHYMFMLRTTWPLAKSKTGLRTPRNISLKTGRNSNRKPKLSA